jgi:hypothetical protein
MASKIQLKKDLKKMGVEIVKGNYVKKSEIKKIIAESEDDLIPAEVKDEIKRYLNNRVKDLKEEIEIDSESYKEDPKDEDEVASIDIRLQWHDGKWAIRTGDSSYDQDRRGYWGASSITPDTEYEELAKDLIDQVEDDMAMSKAEVRSNLRKMGVEIVKGNYIKKSDVKKILAGEKDPVFVEMDRVKKKITDSFPKLSFNENLTEHGSTGNLVYDAKDGDFKIEIGVLFKKGSGYKSEKPEYIYRSFRIEDGSIAQTGKEVFSLEDLVGQIKLLEKNKVSANLKRDLKKLGIAIKDNMVKKSQVEKAIAKVVLAIPSASTPAVKVDCTYDEIVKDAHTTHAPNTYYLDFQKLPECVKDEFEKVSPEIDHGRYTVYKYTAFLRLNVITKDGAELSMEITLGDIELNPQYQYVIDLDERGIFKCHVDSEDGDTVWEASSEDDEDGEFAPVRDGFMKHTKDVDGLEKYLKELKIINEDASLTMDDISDRDDERENVADEMDATFDWRMQDVYFEVDEYPEEGEE